MTALNQARRRYWRAQLFAQGFATDELNALIQLREYYQAGRMLDGKRP